MPRFTLKQLRYFCRLCEAGSFTNAALALNLSQPALHYQMKELESILGVELFKRSPSGITPTQAGATFYSEAMKVLEQCRTATDSIASFKAQKNAMPLVIGMAPSPGKLIGPDIVLRLRELGFSNITVRDGLSSDLIPLVVTREIDVALCYKTPAVRLLSRHHHIADEAMYLLGPSPIVNSKDGAIPFSELTAYQYVLDSPIHTTREIIDALAREGGIRLDIAFEVNSIDMKKTFIEERGFCTIAPYIFAMDGIRAGKIGARRIEGPSIDRRLVLCLSDEVPAHLAPGILDIARKLAATVARDVTSGWSIPHDGADEAAQTPV
ncbi:MAG TPA: LysR family transcriptional regulator [Rhizobiaceae bacterium]|nr:LysR family transcriptional regulator [Rhizobiaceae bacterium]